MKRSNIRAVLFQSQARVKKFGSVQKMIELNCRNFELLKSVVVPSKDPPSSGAEAID